MGKDRRKKDKRHPGSAEGANSVEVNNTADESAPLEPRGQREPRNRGGREHREGSINKDAKAIGKPVAENALNVKNEIKEAPPNPAVLFANLKRETDEIKALQEKKFSRRQIFSNWSRYDEPLPQPYEEQELPGTDFNSLCSTATSEDNYFRFKSERAWDTTVSALSSELFSLNASNVAAGLCCIPLYKKLDLPFTLFSEADVQNMELSAKKCKEQYERLQTDFYKKKEMDILNILRERSNAEDNLLLKVEKEKTPDRIPTLSFNIDCPETPDEFEQSVTPEAYQQVLQTKPQSAAKFTIGIARRASPEVTSRPVSKVHEAAPQHFRENTSRSSAEREQKEAQDFKESMKRHSPESWATIMAQREETIKSIRNSEEDKRQSTEVTDKAKLSKQKINLTDEGVEENVPKTTKMLPQGQSLIQDSKRAKKEVNDTDPEISNNVIQQSTLVAVEESVAETVPEILPPRQLNKNKSKEKNKQYGSEISATIVTTTILEVKSVPSESEQKTETEAMTIVSDILANEDVESEQKPVASMEALGQRSKKRRSREKAQLVNKSMEDAEVPTQVKVEKTNKPAEETQKMQLSLEKVKSPLPEKPSEKSQPTLQEKPMQNVKPKQEKPAEKIKVVQEKPEEKNKSKQDRPTERVKIPAQENTVNVKPQVQDDLDFLLSLKRPVRESQVIAATSTQVSKPSIEEEETSAKPAPFKFPQKTEDLEDWLDSVLDD